MHQRKKKKHLETHIAKEVKDLYSENYKTLKKETKVTNESIYYAHGQ